MAQLRAELQLLRDELKRLDSLGDRRGAIRVLGQMITMQKAFMARWPVDLRPVREVLGTSTGPPGSSKP